MLKEGIRVLVIDDEYILRKDEIEMIKNERKLDFKFDYLSKYEPQKISLKDYHIILLDLHFPEGEMQGEEILKDIRKKGFAGKVIIFTKSNNKRDFLPLIQSGLADDWHWIGLERDALFNTIERLLSKIEYFESKRELFERHYENFDEYTYHPFLTASNATSRDNSDIKLLTTDFALNAENKILTKGPMGKVIEQIELLSESDIPVLILGDTGTGKELVARILHEHHKSKRRINRFIALNCGSIPENTIDVELFGSVEGAFTDAVDKAGVFEQATNYKDNKVVGGGTVFLDEIGTMSPKSQVHLLRVLQEKKVRRLGADITKAYKNDKKGKEGGILKHSNIPVDFRLICATNEDMIKAIKEGRFRLDLFFRIGYAIIKLPRLIERSPEDFSLLFQYFVRKYEKEENRSIDLGKDGKLNKETSSLIKELYYGFPWIGNVRELEGLVRVMVLFYEANQNKIYIPEIFKEVSRQLYMI